MHDSFNGRAIERLIAFDPGGITGVCTYDVRDRYLDYFELDGDNHHLRIDQELNHSLPDVVITERFDYRPKLGHAELISVEYIGVLRLWTQSFDRQLVEQQQLKGKTGLWTDNKLKDLGIYTTNMPHAMDAVRQMLYFVTVTLEDTWWVNQWRAAAQEPRQ